MAAREFWAWLIEEATARPDSVGHLARDAQRAGVKDAASLDQWAQGLGGFWPEVLRVARWLHAIGE